MADIYNTERIQVPENLPEVLTPNNNNQNIIIEKKLYGSDGFRNNLDLSFSETNLIQLFQKLINLTLKKTLIIFLKIMMNYFLIYLMKVKKNHIVLY